MPHAHHFLERLDRVTREQTEFALKLYRDHEAVAYVLSHVKIPEGADRVALSIDDTHEGPFVLVTRDGHFVTCLGKGMKHDRPVVPRAQTDSLLAKFAEKRSRKEVAARELEHEEDEGHLFHRVVSRGSRFAKEDFIALTAFEPMLGLTPYQATLEMALEVLKMRPAMAHGAHVVRINGRTSKTLEKLDRLEWSIAHLALLAGASERPTLDAIIEMMRGRQLSPMYGCTFNAGTTFLLRAAWFGGRLGKAAIPLYKESFANAGDWMAILESAMGLGAIGLRHSATMTEAKHALSGWGPGSNDGPTSNEKARRNAAHVVLEVLDDIERRTAATLSGGQHVCVAYGQHLPEGHPLRFEKPEDVPEDLARTAALAYDADINNPEMQTFVVGALPLAARAAPEDFYFPREVIRAWFGQWDPSETLERLKRFDKGSTQETVRAAPKPGRNDPCNCGSGKKYKKCHGAPGAPTTPAAPAEF